MLSYSVTEDYFIRVSTGNTQSFQRRVAILKETALEIFNFCSSLDEATVKQLTYAKIKEKLSLPNYEGYELFIDIREGHVKLKNDELIVMD